MPRSDLLRSWDGKPGPGTVVPASPTDIKTRTSMTSSAEWTQTRAGGVVPEGHLLGRARDPPRSWTQRAQRDSPAQHEDAQVDFKGPQVDIKGPKLDLRRQRGGDRPRHGGSCQCDWTLARAKLEGDIVVGDTEHEDAQSRLQGPQVDIKGPKIDLKGAKGEVTVPEGEVKLESKGQSRRGHVQGPHAKASGAKLEGDIVVGDTEVATKDSKFKMPKFKMPSFGTSGTGKSIGASVDVSPCPPSRLTSRPTDIKTSDLSIDLPSADVDIKTGELE
ncbi:hypothetical protein QTO34_020217 [Cnephaeus nilssonii]|uniref:Uncharacterized protein n=1 Tax=Cnephaeus nilssonii TaxID=3371016 RepID=A0AA40HY80_CNENI|nr:hypothetical protein QTO34_020217 [Eptesicus nilssonii]